MAIGTQGEACDLICAKSASSARSAGNKLSVIFFSRRSRRTRRFSAELFNPRSTCRLALKKKIILKGLLLWAGDKFLQIKRFKQCHIFKFGIFEFLFSKFSHEFGLRHKSFLNFHSLISLE